MVGKIALWDYIRVLWKSIWLYEYWFDPLIHCYLTTWGILVCINIKLFFPINRLFIMHLFLQKKLCLDATSLLPTNSCVVYTIGQDPQFSFEEEMMMLGSNCTVHMFDPTVQVENPIPVSWEQYYYKLRVLLNLVICEHTLH